MHQIIYLVLSFILTVPAFAQNYQTTGKIIVDDPSLDDLIDVSAGIEILADGFGWSEGPLWLTSVNKLIFSDIPDNSIYEWSESDGLQLYLKPSGYTGEQARGGELGSNALLLASDGSLVLCQHGDRRIAKMLAPLSDPLPKFETLADSYLGKKLNSPNDAVFSKTDELYFTDPPYGLEKNVDDPAKELDFQGVYKLSKSGEIKLLTKALTRPNGIAFSPDGTKLYVANSDPKRAIWMVYDVKKNGGIGNGKVFYDATNLVLANNGLPDGMKVHRNGTVFATGPGGIFIFSPDGKILGKIETGKETANCTFNDDYSALYVTADNYLMRVHLKK
ncbi:SMP-30/gluconolactonase/LRE family protein [Draconibacterium halophilum]|uniref:SMP-30/gluconolactonase/LRE family protein n=1 Tax=Draconibacterium halophilum TaxID=2706887 RepID=A0A6C0R8T2_9BACT|nr:SMP-30/gluconolactonase/LRE family protein [Draconibacterium halophilum]QIA06599.1 SMP-30/gluconolactonase/LRE family protein [Draconibacterium halophilum]